MMLEKRERDFVKEVYYFGCLVVYKITNGNYKAWNTYIDRISVEYWKIYKKCMSKF